MRRVLLLLIAAAALTGPSLRAALAGPELVVNGGFEDQSVAGDGLGGFLGWTLPADNNASLAVTLATGANYVHSGFSAAALGVSAPATLDQVITTVVGATYQFSFALEHVNIAATADSCSPGDASCFPINNSFSAAFGSKVVVSLSNVTIENSCSSFSATNCYPDPTPVYTVTADSTATDILFTFQDAPDSWALDDVSVTALAIPEPPSWTMILAGVVLVFLRAPQKQKPAVAA